MPDHADHPLQAECFPLIPYCNRIAAGQFSFAGRAVRLAPNLPPEAHPLHGESWLRTWRIVRSDMASGLLEDIYDGDGDLPLAYRAHQHIALDETGCTLRLMVENTSTEPAPIGLVLHPYFRRLSDTEVRFASDAMLGIDAEFLPDDTRRDPTTLADWPKGARLPDELVDNCFAGWSGNASIRDRQGTITLRGFGTPYCHVFAPPGGEELCIEPISRPPDALNRAPGTMTVVQPGTATGVAIRIETGV